jgi:hypothetical protein
LLFEDRFAKAGWRVREWLLKGNAAMAPRYATWRERYDFIMDQHHAKPLK